MVTYCNNCTAYSIVAMTVRDTNLSWDGRLLFMVSALLSTVVGLNLAALTLCGGALLPWYQC